MQCGSKDDLVGNELAPATATSTPTPEPAQACIWTAALNVFVREGPGASNYPVVDDMLAGESAPVVGESLDAEFCEWAT